MPITLNCPTCNHEYTLSTKLAGKNLRCKYCQGAIQVPGQPVTAGIASRSSAPQTFQPQAEPTPQPVRPAIAPTRSRPAPPPATSPVQSGTMSYHTPSTWEPSKFRRTAARNCILLAVIGYLAMVALIACAALALTIIASVNDVTPDRIRPEAVTAFQVFCMVLAGIAGVISTIYLVLGFLMPKRGIVTPILSIVFASLGTLGMLVFLAIMVTRMAAIGTNTIGAVNFIVLVLYLVIQGQLIYAAVRTLIEPKDFR